MHITSNTPAPYRDAYLRQCIENNNIPGALLALKYFSADSSLLTDEFRDRLAPFQGAPTKSATKQ